MRDAGSSGARGEGIDDAFIDILTGSAMLPKMREAFAAESALVAAHTARHDSFGLARAAKRDRSPLLLRCIFAARFCRDRASARRRGLVVTDFARGHAGNHNAPPVLARRPQSPALISPTDSVRRSTLLRCLQ